MFDFSLCFFGNNLNEAFNIAWIIDWRLTDPFLHYLRIPAVGLRVLNFPLLFLILFTVWGETPSC